MKRSRLKRTPFKPRKQRSPVEHSTSGNAWAEDPNSEAWKKKCALLWREIVVRMYGGRCIVGELAGGCEGSIEVHHLVSRSCERFYADPVNGVPLCAHHHRHSRECSPHGSPRAFEQFIHTHYPTTCSFLLTHRGREWKRYKSWKEIYGMLEEKMKGLDRDVVLT